MEKGTVVPPTPTHPPKKEEEGGGVGWERGKGVKMEVGKADVEGRDLNVN